MDNSVVRKNVLNTVTNQPSRKTSNPNDLLAKIRPSTKTNLVRHLTQSNSIPISSGLKILSTRIQANDDPSYQPLVTISDNDHSDEDDFVSPVHKLTKNELREELRAFRQNEDSTRNGTDHSLLANNSDDEDTGDIEFRMHQSKKPSNCCYRYSTSFKNSFCTIS